MQEGYLARWKVHIIKRFLSPLATSHWLLELSIVQLDQLNPSNIATRQLLIVGVQLFFFFFFFCKKMLK
jgi:hypothetical protein